MLIEVPDNVTLDEVPQDIELDNENELEEVSQSLSLDEVPEDIQLDEDKVNTELQDKQQKTFTQSEDSTTTRPFKQDYNPTAISPIEQDKQIDTDNKAILYGAGEDYENSDVDIANIGKGLIERGNDLVVNTLEGGQAVVDYAEEQFGATNTQMFQKMADWSKGTMGYIPSHNEGSVKEAFKKGGLLDIDTIQEGLLFGAEQMGKSIPDMGVMITQLPLYIFSRTKEMADDRAVNDGREEGNIADMAKASPFVLASVFLDRLGLKATTSDILENVGKEILKKGWKEASKKVSKEVAKGTIKESWTEFIQEGAVESTGERLGTKSEAPLIDIERGAFSALAGGVGGGAISSVTATGSQLYKAHNKNTQPTEDEIRADEQNKKFAEAIGHIDKAMPDATDEEKADIANRVVGEFKDDIENIVLSKVGIIKDANVIYGEKREATPNLDTREKGAVTDNTQPLEEVGQNEEVEIDEKKEVTITNDELNELYDLQDKQHDEDFTQEQQDRMWQLEDIPQGEPKKVIKEPIKEKSKSSGYSNKPISDEEGRQFAVDRIKYIKDGGLIDKAKYKEQYGKPYVYTDHQDHIDGIAGQERRIKVYDDTKTPTLEESKQASLKKKKPSPRAEELAYNEQQFSDSEDALKDANAKLFQKNKSKTAENIIKNMTKEDIAEEDRKHYEGKYPELEFQRAYDNIDIDTKTVKGSQATLAGLEPQGQNALFDTADITADIVPKWAKDIVSDTLPYSDIVKAITDTKQGKHTELSDRVMNALHKAGSPHLKNDIAKFNNLSDRFWSEGINELEEVELDKLNDLLSVYLTEDGKYDTGAKETPTTWQDVHEVSGAIKKGSTKSESERDGKEDEKPLEDSEIPITKIPNNAILIKDESTKRRKIYRDSNKNVFIHYKSAGKNSKKGFFELKKVSATAKEEAYEASIKRVKEKKEAHDKLVFIEKVERDIETETRLKEERKEKKKSPLDYNDVERILEEDVDVLSEIVLIIEKKNNLDIRIEDVNHANTTNSVYGYISLYNKSGNVIDKLSFRISDHTKSDVKFAKNLEIDYSEFKNELDLHKIATFIETNMQSIHTEYVETAQQGLTEDKDGQNVKEDEEPLTLLYHGSPVRFDVPSMDYYGDGEGGLGYGYGFHTTLSKESANNYAVDTKEVRLNEKIIYPNTTEYKILVDLKELGYKDLYKKIMNTIRKKPNIEFPKKRLEILKKLKDSKINIQKIKGTTYQINIGNEVLNTMLNFNLKLSSQAKNVKNILMKENIYDSGESGEDLYYFMSKQLGGDKEASEFFDDIGIKGIIYVDDIERLKRDISVEDAIKNNISNYTIFNPTSLKIYPLEDTQQSPIEDKDGQNVKEDEKSLDKDTTFKHSKSTYKKEIKEPEKRETKTESTTLYSNPIHLLLKGAYDATEGLTNVVGKLNDIVYKSSLSKIENTKFYEWFRKHGGSENGLGLLSKGQEKAFLKHYRKLQSTQAMANIDAKKKAALLDNIRGDIAEDLFNEGAIRYLENPEVREEMQKEFPEIAKELDKVRDYIDTLSKDAMDRGLIKQSQFEKWQDKYLSRLYLVRESMQTLNVEKGIKIGKMASGRKIDSIIDYLQENPEEAERLNVILDPIAMIKQTIAKTQSNIGIEDFLRNVINFEDLVEDKYLVNLGEPINNLPLQFSPDYANTTILPYIKDLKDSIKRKAIDREIDILEDEDKKLVEKIRELSTNDRKLYKKYNKLFEDYDILNEDEQKEIGEYQEQIDDIKEQRDEIKKDLAQFKETKERSVLPSTKHYGAVSGIPVTSDMASLIRSQMSVVHAPEMLADRADRWLALGLGYLKWAWVPANIFAYSRNFFGNSMQWIMGGSNPVAFPVYTSRAVWSYIKKDKWYDIAQEQGMIDTNEISFEINNLLNESTESKSKILKTLTRGMKAVGGAFGWVDNMVKVAQMTYQMEQKGKTKEEAVDKAQSVHYDYSLTADIVRAMRDPKFSRGSAVKLLGTLFPTFTQKSIAFLAESMLKRPVTMLLMGASLALLFGVDDDDKETLEKKYGKAKAKEIIADIESDKPKWMKYNPLVKTNIKIDKRGKIKVIYTDFSYSIPFGSILTSSNAIIHGDVKQGFSNLGMGSNPVQMFGDFLSNTDGFTKKPIYYEYNEVQETKDKLKWLAKSFAPGTLTKLHSLYETRHPVAPRLIGINQYVYSKDELNIWHEFSARDAMNRAKERTREFVRKIQQAEEKFEYREISKKELDNITAENMKEIEYWIELGATAYKRERE